VNAAHRTMELNARDYGVMFGLEQSLFGLVGPR
jgi:hypothetical protein